ncbi:PD-(D/E)XK nuclease family protein [Mucilaginibacter sp. UR6-1]|uniref:PD-(D/E)XK nuclease family protein n=1 Tax=Mucilaginibacter sp. UR6-1 TaxID=1435643 RepID=UPI001E62D593|nr:PD-(D/E)XK nuclease family protein [Mucilaginibacter sp. UR6-1]MCC8407675.1 PD-(D/E)XK nuclease family protein [Mucilaginibacter sp. UR6-1]
MKPNIFSIATKELHQDAFIAWLLQWADPDNWQYDEDLHNIGTQFVMALLMKNHDSSDLKIIKVRAGRQWENIDVYAEVDTNKGKYLIVIEDKTFTKERIGQLERYRKSGEKWCEQNNASLGCIYLKTGSESQKRLGMIRHKGFQPFNRKEFIEILNHFPVEGNNILIDFRERLHQLQKAHDAFESTIIGKWNDACWIGFYQFLEDNLGITDWHLVNPPGGESFWNAVLNWRDWHGFPVYLQIEQGKLCFKISHLDSDIEDYTKSEIRNLWHDVIKKNAGAADERTIRRPERFGTGDYMTCAVVHKSDWLGSGESLINKTLVLQNLIHYKSFLESLLLVPRPY